MYQGSSGLDPFLFLGVVGGTLGEPASGDWADLRRGILGSHLRVVDWSPRWGLRGPSLKLILEAARRV